MDAEIVDLKKWKAAHQQIPAHVLNHALASVVAWQQLWLKLFFSWPSK